MKRFKEVEKIIILMSVMTLFLSVFIFAQIEPYDPSKEPPFDKEQLLKEIKEMVSIKHPSLVNRYILDTYIRPERYQAAIFILEALKNIPEFDQRNFMRAELCLCYLFSGRINKNSGIDCLRKIYLSNIYPNVDLGKVSAEEKNRILEKCDYNVIYGLLLPNTYNFNRERIIQFIEEQIDSFLAKYKESSKEEREFLTHQEYLFERGREERKLAEQRKTLRKKQILEYIKELEILLVARDEQRLSEFFDKYAFQGRKESLMKHYINSYFNKNYTSVHFNLVDYSNMQLMGTENELESVHYIVITIPESKGEGCPEISYSVNESYLYCYGFFWFKFIDEKIYEE